MDSELRKRERSILQAIISSYIATGEPVGSRVLSRRLDMKLSPATIRNIMADLEELGYLRQPHVSAGRVPTDKAYRFYVDGLVESDPGDPTLPALDLVWRRLEGETGDLLREASRALSDLSRYVGLVMAPRFINTVLRHIEFVRLGPRKVLAILVSQEGIIQNKLLATDRERSQRELDGLAAALNARYADRPLREVREAILADMARDKELYDSLLARAIELGRRTVEAQRGAGDIWLEGTANILSLPEFADIDKMRSLFRAFDEKRHLAEILDRCIDADGVKIFIGAENPHRELHELSLVTAPYRKEGQVLGVIGVLGPTRMEYGRVISMVDQAARRLSLVLSAGEEVGSP